MVLKRPHGDQVRVVGVVRMEGENTGQKQRKVLREVQEKTPETGVVVILEDQKKSHSTVHAKAGERGSEGEKGWSG